MDNKIKREKLKRKILKLLNSKKAYKNKPLVL